MPRVFLSYHRADGAIAQRLSSDLRGYGVEVFLDTTEVAAGASWQIAIVDAIGKSDLVIVIWSRIASTSEWVVAEASRAADLGKYFPVVIDDAELPLQFNDYNTFRVKPSELDKVVAEVVRRLSLQSKPSTERERETSDTHESVRKALDAAEEIGKAVQRAPKRKYSPQRHAYRVSVFIAHASNDKPMLRAPINALLKAGFKVWIDRPFELGLDPEMEKLIGGDRIHYGDDWRDRIKRAIDRASVVLTCWSKDAIRGRREQFYYEVFCGLVQQKLVQCRIDKVPIDEIGMPYTFSHIADLSEFDAENFNPQMETLMHDLSDRRKSYLASFWGRS